jgi:hypothetical protein
MYASESYTRRKICYSDVFSPFLSLSLLLLTSNNPDNWNTTLTVSPCKHRLEVQWIFIWDSITNIYSNKSPRTIPGATCTSRTLFPPSAMTLQMVHEQKLNQSNYASIKHLYMYQLIIAGFYIFRLLSVSTIQVSTQARSMHVKVAVSVPSLFISHHTHNAHYARQRV